MRIHVWLRFWGEDIPGGPWGILGPAGIGPDAVEMHEMTIRGNYQISVAVSLPEGDERLPGLRALLKQHGVNWLEALFDRYTDEEVDNARLLLVEPVRKCQVDGGSRFGTTYDLKGTCPTCGAGARQTSAMFLDGWDDQHTYKLEGHRAAQTLRGELLVDDRLAAELDALAPTGLLLHHVYSINPDTKRQTKLAWKQLSADRVLPPMSPLTRNVDRDNPSACPVCTRGGYMMGQQPRVVYRARDLESAGDLNLSWEGQYRGEVSANPRECSIPVPYLLVTPKVMRVFRAAGVTEFEWIPIRVVDE